MKRQKAESKMTETCGKCIEFEICVVLIKWNLILVQEIYTEENLVLAAAHP